jgi:hypothetical protein
VPLCLETHALPLSRVPHRGKVNAIVYMSIVNASARLLTDGGEEVQDNLGSLVFAGFSQLAPDFTWWTFFYLHTAGG